MSPPCLRSRGDGGADAPFGGLDRGGTSLVSARGGAILTAVLVLPLTIPTLIFRRGRGVARALRRIAAGGAGASGRPSCCLL